MPQVRNFCSFNLTVFENWYSEQDYTGIKNVPWPDLDTTDCEKVKVLCSYRGEGESSLVHIAAYYGSLNILQRAHASGLSLTVTDELGRCALHFATGQGHFAVVEWLTEQPSVNEQLELRDNFGRTPLHLAVIKKRLNVVKFLVDGGVDVNVRDRNGMTPLHYAPLGVDHNCSDNVWRYAEIVIAIVLSPGFNKIIDEEIKVVEQLYSAKLLFWAVLLNSHRAVKVLLEHGLDVDVPCRTRRRLTPLHVAAIYDYHRIMCTLLKFPKYTDWMINAGDYDGQTPLHVAVRGDSSMCTDTLIDNGASLVAKDKKGQTVIHYLFKYRENPVEFLTGYLDVAISATGDCSDTVELDFKPLIPRGERQMAVVSALIGAVPSVRQMNILQHPLVETFLGLKWRLLRNVFVILVLFQASFATCLFTYSIILLRKEEDNPAARRVLFVASVVMLCHNILQILVLPKYYAKQFETWFSVFCATVCIVITVTAEFGFDRRHHGERSPAWVLQAMSVAILLTCIQMMLLVGQFPAWGCYALMFSTVLKNVLKVFLAVVWIIVGFSLSFSILFHDNEQFDNPGKAFEKTVVMMMGEYEYSNLFATTNDAYNSTFGNVNPSVNGGMVSTLIGRTVFLVFIMLASIVLMNLMIGLAVTDIQGLLNESLVLRLIKQAEFATHLEHVTSHWILQRGWVPRPLKQLLEFGNKIPVQLRLGQLDRRGIPSLGISRELAGRLFDLAFRNKNLRKKSQTTSPDSLSETLLCIQEEVKKLRLELNRTREVRCPKCDAEGPKIDTDSRL